MSAIKPSLITHSLIRSSPDFIVLATLTHDVLMSASGSASHSPALPVAKRQKLVAELSVLTSTKSGLAKVLKSLHDRGLLGGDVGSTSERTIRKSAQIGIEEVAHSSTPDGNVVRDIELLPWRETRDCGPIRPFMVPQPSPR